MSQSEMPLPVLLPFLQGACVLHLASLAPALAYCSPEALPLTWVRELRPLGPGLVDAVAVEMTCNTLTYLSDADVLLALLYDPAFPLDRSHSGSGPTSRSGFGGGGGGGGAGEERSGGAVFPEGYVSAMVGRAVAVGAGQGWGEVVEAAKGAGFKGSFLPICRPKALDIR